MTSVICPTSRQLAGRPVEPSRDRGLLFGGPGIGGCGVDERELEQIELASQVGRQIEVIEAGGLEREGPDGVNADLALMRVERLRVVRDVGLGDPPGLILQGAQAQQRLVGAVHKGHGLGVGRCWSRATGTPGTHDQEQAGHHLQFRMLHASHRGSPVRTFVPRR
jgi:hypothetical protein